MAPEGRGGGANFATLRQRKVSRPVGGSAGPEWLLPPCGGELDRAGGRLRSSCRNVVPAIRESLAAYPAAGAVPRAFKIGRPRGSGRLPRSA